MKGLNLRSVGIPIFAILVFLVAGIVYSSAADKIPVPVEGGNLYFDKDSGAIVDCDAEVTKAVIPLMVDGVSVTSIGSRAFDGCTALEQIELADSIETIGDHAFWGCAMKEVKLPESVADIGWGAFYECKGLKTVTLPSSLQAIPAMCFSDCDVLTKIKIGQNVQTIGEWAFQNCKALKEITLPDSVKTFGQLAFSGCSSLEKITFPELMEAWGASVFQGCEQLTKIDIPKGLETIDEKSFYECKNLTEVAVPEGVKFVNYNAFQWCYKLRKITLPQSIQKIDENAFGGMDYKLFTVYGYRDTPAEMITYQFVNLGPAWTVNRLTGYQDRNGTVALKWDKRSDAKGYVIYRKERSGRYEKIGETLQTSYNDLGIVLGTIYDYKIRPYRERGTRYIEGDDSRAVTVEVKDFTGNQIPQWEYTQAETESSSYAPKQIQIRTQGARAIELTWTSDVAQNHFYVYRSSSPNGKYTYVGQYLNGYKKAQLTDKKVKAGETYYYRIKPAVESKWSKPVKAKVVPDRPQLKTKGLRGKKAGLTWKKVSGADGYYIYRAEKKNGKYKKIKTIKGNQTSFTDKKLKKKHYYYKIKAYDRIAKKSYTSSYSNIGHVKRAAKGYYQ